MRTFTFKITNGTEVRTISVEAMSDFGASIKVQRENPGWQRVKRQIIVPIPSKDDEYDGGPTAEQEDQARRDHVEWRAARANGEANEEEAEPWAW